jgi:hypothetical protein
VDGDVWHRTGDAGWVDAAGRLWLLGRCSAKLPTYDAPAGFPENVLCYPFAIECALRESFTGIRMAAIEWHGRRLLVVAKRCNDREIAAIRDKARGLGMEHLLCLDSLPMDRRHNAKIDYPRLREMIAGHDTLEMRG